MKNWRTSCIQKDNYLRIYAALAALVLAVSLLNLCLGAEKVPPAEVLRALTGGGSGTTAFRIVRYVRLPRLCACLLAGGALAASGAIIQGVLSNALAAPSTIGVNAGAGLTVALCCAIAPTAVKLVPLAAMAGAFLGVMTVLLIARRTGASKITLVLAGVAVSSIFSAGIDAVVTFVPEALNGYSDFRIGGFSGVSMARLLPALWPALLSFVLSLSLHNEMDVLLLGREQAQSLGLPAERLRIVLLGLAAVLAGSAVSVGGLVGFVGLIVPHIMRRLVGEESGPLLVSSVLGGAALLGGCDLLGRMLFAPYEIPVGIVMALAGGPFFIWLLQRRGRLHD
ncbi:iron ABC transporter permease [Oscillibacter valericigenes]|uniref:FecCD family ABC transporter permease n=1 Tax=Oscillibacter valericigenes TaxID=351091 RepID=UPI001F1BE9F7|nr:iron ABC transporter permease [Oscillibacter valericigenes]MCF2616184.1 iron ABC transporter permease [Oscillibacter valericigenes]